MFHESSKLHFYKYPCGSQNHFWTIPRTQVGPPKTFFHSKNLRNKQYLKIVETIWTFFSQYIYIHIKKKWLVSFCPWMENGWIIMREDGSFRNEFPDEQIAFKKYEEFKKNILILMLIFLVCLKNCYLLF